MPAAISAPLLDSAGKASKQVALDGDVFARRGEAASRPRDRARGAERAARRHTRRQEPRARLRRPLQAVAPEGHRPGARRHDARAALDRRRRRLPADDAALRGQGQPQGEARRSARRAVRSRAGGHARPGRRQPRSTSRRRSRPPALVAAWGKERPLVVVAADDDVNLGQSFRNLEQRRWSSRRPSSRSPPSSGPARCSSREAALAGRLARAAPATAAAGAEEETA